MQVFDKVSNTPPPPAVRHVNTGITASIVTYRAGQVISTCLECLFASTRHPLDIVVFDNASDDDTLARLAPYSASVCLMRNTCNIGFGKGHNMALSNAKDGYYLLLNPDVELTEGSLDRLAAYLDAHPECGAVAPLLAEGEDGKLGGFELSYPGQSFLPSGWRRLLGRVAFLKGACMLVRSELFRRLGGFDPRFFLYAEDLDLSLQIRRAGYTVECLEDVIVGHVGGYSESSRTPCFVAQQKYGALLQFYEKHYPKATIYLLMARDLMRFSVRRLAHILTPGRETSRKADEYLGRLRAWGAFVSSWPIPGQTLSGSAADGAEPELGRGRLARPRFSEDVAGISP